MAILSQQTLHIASASNNTPGAIVRGLWHDGRAEGSERGAIVNCGGRCTGRRVVAFSSSFHDLPALQFDVHGGGLSVSKFLSFHGQVVTKWHWIRNVRINRWPPLRRRASRGDESESSSAEETNDTDKETIEDQSNSKINADEQDAESQESGGEIREVSREEETEGETSEGSREDVADHDKNSLQYEGSKKSFWRKIWEPGQKDEDNTLGAEEELLLQDLENLRFEWRGLLDPSWENLLALGFAALLTLAFLKIFSQLFLVVITIVLSALKYTVLAALLLGLLIFLL